MVVNGLDVNEYSEGEGETLLFLHGWGVGHDLYLPLLRHLSKRFRVFAPDLPGFGKTTEPTEPWDAERYADFVIDYCKAHGIEPAVCAGHSNGGRVLITLLSRVNSPCKPGKLILLDSAGLPAKHDFSYHVKVKSYKLAKLLLRPFPPLLRALRAKSGSEDYRAASEVMKATMSRLLKTDVTPLLAKLSMPTLLVWGDNDTATPLSDGKLMEKLIPDAGLVTMSGGHWAFMENFNQTLRVLDSFLG